MTVLRGQTSFADTHRPPLYLSQPRWLIPPPPGLLHRAVGSQKGMLSMHGHATPSAEECDC